MDSEISDWIKSAAAKLGIAARPLSPERSNEIISQVRAALVSGNPRAWWMSPRTPAKSYDIQSYRLEEILPSIDSLYWFIPETEEDTPPVFDLKISEIKAIIGECPYFEYYVLNKDNRWFVAESDHNHFHVVSAD